MASMAQSVDQRLWQKVREHAASRGFVDLSADADLLNAILDEVQCGLVLLVGKRATLRMTNRVMRAADIVDNDLDEDRLPASEKVVRFALRVWVLFWQTDRKIRARARVWWQGPVSSELRGPVQDGTQRESCPWVSIPIRGRSPDRVNLSPLLDLHVLPYITSGASPGAGVSSGPRGLLVA